MKRIILAVAIILIGSQAFARDYNAEVTAACEAKHRWDSEGQLGCEINQLIALRRVLRWMSLWLEKTARSGSDTVEAEATAHCGTKHGINLPTTDWPSMEFLPPEPDGVGRDPRQADLYVASIFRATKGLG